MTSYFDILSEDLLTVVLSKVQSKVQTKDDLENLEKEYIKVYYILNNINKLKVLIKFFDSDLYKYLNELGLTIKQWKFAYYLSLVDKILLKPYMIIKDIDLESPGHMTTGKYLTWNDIYNFFMVNTKTDLVEDKGSLVCPDYLKNSGLVSCVNSVFLYIMWIYDKKKNPMIIPSFVTIIIPFQYNYCIYNKILNDVDSLRINRLIILFSSPVRITEIFNKLSGAGYTQILDDIELIISDLQNRL